jgi:hypothetical protein
MQERNLVGFRCPKKERVLAKAVRHSEDFKDKHKVLVFIFILYFPPLIKFLWITNLLQIELEVQNH